MIKKIATGLALASVCTLSWGAPTVHFSDFISDGARTNFNGFEGIPNDGTHFTGGSGPYVEGGISVQQINGDPGNDIWVTYTFGGQHQGNFSWYPDSGDHGYTMITRSGGLGFDSIGMLLGSGFGTPSNYFYELLNGGSTVLSGSFGGAFSAYLGFSGGGFDTILLADCSGCDATTTTLTDGHYNALALDSIELTGAGGTIPEPGSLALVAAGLFGLGSLRRRVI